MFDDFFVRALLAGLGVAAITGPLGCFVVWRRMAYFGDTMAHSGLLGVALGFVLGIHLVAGVTLVCALVALALYWLSRAKSLATDTLLGVLSHSALALGVVLVASMKTVRIDLMALLFGDLLAVSRADVILIYLGAALVLAILLVLWRPLVALSVDPDLAQAEGIDGPRHQLILLLLISLTIALAMKVVGVVLITSLLIIPAAAARRLAVTPEQMALGAALLGAVACGGGLFGSLAWDTPAGPSVVLAAGLLFILTWLPLGLLRRQADRR